LDGLKKCSALDRVITSFHQELSFLPDVLEKIDAATEKIGLWGQYENPSFQM
jgi:hypothetical protein